MKSTEVLTRYQSDLRKNLKVKHSQFGEAKDRQGTITARFRNLSMFFTHHKPR